MGEVVRREDKLVTQIANQPAASGGIPRNLALARPGLAADAAHGRTVLPACQSHTRMTLFSPADAICRPLGVKTRPLISAICRPVSSCRIGVASGSLQASRPVPP